MPKYKGIVRYPELTEIVVEANNIDAAVLEIEDQLSDLVDPSVKETEIEIEMIEEIED